MKHPFKSGSIKNYRYDSLNKVKCMIYQHELGLIYKGYLVTLRHGGPVETSNIAPRLGLRGHQPSASVTSV